MSFRNDTAPQQGVIINLLIIAFVFWCLNDMAAKYGWQGSLTWIFLVIVGIAVILSRPQK